MRKPILMEPIHGDWVPGKRVDRLQATLPWGNRTRDLSLTATASRAVRAPSRRSAMLLTSRLIQGRLPPFLVSLATGDPSESRPVGRSRFGHRDLERRGSDLSLLP